MTQVLANLISRSNHRGEFRKLRNRARVAGALGALIAERGLKHVHVAKKAGMKPSQLSRQLSGDANLTLDSLTAICAAADVDFDLIFRKEGEKALMQWWERAVIRERRRQPQAFANDMVLHLKHTAKTWLPAHAPAQTARADCQLARYLGEDSLSSHGGRFTSDFVNNTAPANDAKKSVAA